MMSFIALIYDFWWFLDPKSNHCEIHFGRESPLKRKLLNAQTHRKNPGFLMILMVCMFDCFDEKSSTSCQQSEAQSNRYGGWICDGNLFSFGRILASRIDQKSFQKGCWKAMPQGLQAEQPKKRSWEALRPCDWAVFGPGKGVGGRVNPSQKGW